MNTKDARRLLTAREVSEQTGLTVGHLSNLRHEGKGPEYVRLGGAVRYRQSVIDEWAAASTVAPRVVA